MAQVKHRVFEAVAGRVGEQWGITVPEVPGAFSMVRRLAHAEEHIREAIAYVSGIKPADFDVHLSLRLPGGVEQELQDARSLAAQAEEMQREAAERTRMVVKQLSADGITGGDISMILGVSKQRVSQLLATSG